MSQQIASKMKEIRHRLQLSQTDVAKAAGLSKSYITHVEKGDMTPGLEFAFKIEKALKLSSGELSDLVIKEVRAAAGLVGSYAAPAVEYHQAPLSPTVLDAVCLSQTCPSCGGKVPFKISLS